MPVSKDVLGAGLVGVVIGGIIAGLLDLVLLPLSATLQVPIPIIVGALFGGGIAGYVLNGKPPQAMVAGALAGLLSTPFYLGVGDLLTIFGAIPLQNTTPPLWQLQEAVASIFIMFLAFDIAGATTVGFARHPHPVAQPLQPTVPGATPGQSRYCVQCGAQLPAGTVVCPYCNARQPT
jgi:hypothetical protein